MSHVKSCPSVMPCLLLFLSTIAFAATSPDCQTIRSIVNESLKWRPVEIGLSFAHVDLRTPYLRDLTLVRYSSARFLTRAYDLRDLVAESQRKGQYSPPLFSLNEVRLQRPRAAVIASAGMTLSFLEPIPAGFLRIDGRDRSRLATKDAILNGVVCLKPNGGVSVLSEMTPDGRRAPKNVSGCTGGFQAGPVINWGGNPTATQHGSNVARVFFATLESNQVIVGYSNQATTLGLGCGLSADSVGVLASIGMQGMDLGGLSLSSQFGDATSFGILDATIASAVIIESTRSGSQ